MKIILIGKLSSAFIAKDYEILQENFDVDVIEPPSTLFEWLRYPFKIRKKIREADLVFCWFAGLHSASAVYYAKRYKKKSIVVAGGYDAADVPEIRYGAFSKIKEKLPAKYVFSHSDLVLAVSEFTKKEVVSKVKVNDIKVVYNGVNVEKYVLKGKKESIVITVSGIKKNNLMRKGIETFVKTAKFLPEIKFLVIGKYIDDSIEYLRSIASNNVDFTGFISDEELIDLYQRAKVICQLSYYEAFGLAPAEGMACGCIPVVTKERSGMSEFVQDAGFYVSYGNENQTAEAIKKALNSSELSLKKTRERIREKFSLEIRKKLLLKEINRLI